MSTFSLKHDYHFHTISSLCCKDPGQTVEFCLRFAAEQGLDGLCFTDHLWQRDGDIPDISFYQQQDIQHVRQSLPLPERVGDTQVFFGCETEYCGGTRLGLSRQYFDWFDFVVIPLNHFHFTPFVRPAEVQTAQARGELLLSRLEELQALDLPWEKVGLAHLVCGLMAPGKDLLQLLHGLDEVRLARIMAFYAKKGTGIELNAGAMQSWTDDPEAYLKIFRIAKEAGCRFYNATDAHSNDGMYIYEDLRPFVDALGLSAADRFYIRPGTRTVL